MDESWAQWHLRNVTTAVARPTTIGGKVNKRVRGWTTCIVLSSNARRWPNYARSSVCPLFLQPSLPLTHSVCDSASKRYRYATGAKPSFLPRAPHQKRLSSSPNPHQFQVEKTACLSSSLQKVTLGLGRSLTARIPGRRSFYVAAAAARWLLHQELGQAGSFQRCVPPFQRPPREATTSRTQRR